MDVFPGGTPTKEALDAIVPDRPAFLTNRDGHGAWVNSRALELAGITRDTPDPRDGRIERNPDGEPSGHAARGRDDASSPPSRRVDTDEDYAAGLRVAQAYLHSLGITAWQDAIVGYRRQLPHVGHVCARGGQRRAHRPGDRGALVGPQPRRSSRSSGSSTLRARATVGRFAPTSVKIMQDGIIENFTAATLTPYLDANGEPTDNAGHLVRRSRAA